MPTKQGLDLAVSARTKENDSGFIPESFSLYKTTSKNAEI